MTETRIQLRSPQAAKRIGISASTLAKWRMKKIGPPYHRCGPRIVFYFSDEIDQWYGDNITLPENDLSDED
jgi:predicted DNA-binding transcriptional regulator AlpA